MIDIPKEIEAANERLPIDLSQTPMPLDMTVRAMALTLAQRHCGDITVKEGNLYQQLKMDNKLGGPLTVDHVISTALVFERYLWGEWSKEIVGHALADTLDEAKRVLDKEFTGEPPNDGAGIGVPDEITPEDQESYEKTIVLRLNFLKNKPIGEKLKGLRKMRGLSQETLALVLQISRSHLANIEREKDRAGRDLLIKAANYFEVSMDWLVDEGQTKA